MAPSIVDHAAPSPNSLVTDVKLSTVKPLHKTIHLETIDPTFNDLPFADMYVATMYAYRLEDNSQDVYMQLMHRMKESLQKVLVPFFSYAGRWIATPITGSNDSNRKLLCNDEGVPFIEAYVDKDLDSIVHPSVAFQAVPELHGYEVLGMDVTHLKQQMPLDGLPCIFVQVTRFKCGGVVLAVNFNHTHTDATGFFDFMTAWSDLSRANETAVKVDHNRALGEVPYLRKLILENVTNYAKTAEPSKQVKSDVRYSTMGPWDMRAFEVTPPIIKSLKQEAKDKVNGPGFVSTGDCIAAHLWKSLARLPSSMLGGKEAAIQLVVEGRSKFYDPPLPSFLSGNHIAPMIPTQIPVRELQGMPLASCACNIREQLQTIRKEEWLGLPRWKGFEKYRSGKFALMPVTSWFNFPMYEMDFGIGKPFFTSRVNNLWSEIQIGAASIEQPIPSTSSTSVATVRLWSTHDVLKTLESDPLFVTFFLPH